MDLSLAHLVVLFETYNYAILFPIAILEGPIATVLAGFLSTLEFFNPFLIYLTVVVADLVGDTFWYLVGAWGGDAVMSRHGHRFGVTPEKLQEARTYFVNNHRKAITASKLIHGIGFVGLIAAGSLKIPFFKYITISFYIALLQCATFLLIGILFGGAYVYIDKYMSTYAAVATVAVLFVLAFIAFIYYTAKK